MKNLKLLYHRGIFIFCSVCLLTVLFLRHNASADENRKTRFEKLELFNKVLFLVESQYYRQVDTEKLMMGAIKGMMDTLDPHSTFLAKKDFVKMKEETQGEFGGVGIEVTQKDGVIVVIAPIEDTPAYRAGLRPGDKIVEIEHESIMGITLDQAIRKMKGKPKTPVTIGVIKKGGSQVKHVTLIREIIKSKPAKGTLIAKKHLYVRLSQFQKGSGQSIIEIIKKMRKKTKKDGGIKGMILDLRSNPGGLLEEAVNVSSVFLRSGVVVSAEGRDGKSKEIRYVKKGGFKDWNTPLAVLINSSSASASEIVAGALQDAERAIIMGERSFGKGSIQSVSKIDEEKGVKLTVAQYMTPKGRRIQAIGITPDIKLRQFDTELIQKYGKDKEHIRESDLRNYLTATIETPKEKQLRLEREREERLKRIKKIKDKKKKTEKTKKQFPKRYRPEDDYQVLLAIDYLKGFDVYKKIMKSNVK